MGFAFYLLQIYISGWIPIKRWNAGINDYSCYLETR